jgi:hypothetical protein
MVSSEMLRRVALERTDISEEISASFIRVTRIGELGTTLSVTDNLRTLRRNTKGRSSVHSGFPMTGSLRRLQVRPGLQWR